MIQEANLQWRYEDTEVGLVMPWYTLPALKWLKQQDTKSWKVFEYGCGYSTIWWRLNCSLLKSIDSDRNWSKAMGAWHISSKESYIEGAIIHPDKWDCIIVDGVDREECTAFCLPYLEKGGVLIIDNYDSENYDIGKTEEILRGWPVVIHKQPNHTVWQTAIFTKPL